MKRTFTVLIACMFFTGACAIQTKTGTVTDADVMSAKAPEGTVTGSGAGFTPSDTDISRLEGELRRNLADSEISMLKRKRDMLVLICSSDTMFGFDSFAIKSGARSEIRRVAETLYRYPETRIRIEGHTDSIGAAEANQKLSERRADAVKDELTALSLPADRIEVVGFGAARPVASNKTPDGRRRNRRIQLLIMPGAAR